MTYATRTDLELRYGADEIAQRESALPTGALDVILADADALIDGYLAGGYTLPLSPVPAKLLQVACAVACYYLMGAAVMQRARDDYTDAVAWLKDVQNGVVVLQASAPIPLYAPSTVAMVEPVKSVFKRAGRP
jgi:phage gp36-like protein